MREGEAFPWASSAEMSRYDWVADVRETGVPTCTKSTHTEKKVQKKYLKF